MPIIRHTPLKQNIRVWYDYLKTAIQHKYKINKDYYSAWHLPQVKKLTFDKWWISHKHLFAHKQFINVRVLNELSLNDAMKEVKRQLIGKVDQTTNFHITSKKFRYKEVDDYLKCWKLRQTLVYSKRFKEMRPMSYLHIAYKLRFEYAKKIPLYEKKNSKLIKRKFKALTKIEKQKENVLHSVAKRVNNAKTIIKNTAKGQFTGKY